MFRVTIGLVVCVLFSPLAQAALTLRVDDAVFSPGATSGTVDVFVASDNADAILGLGLTFELVDGGELFDPPGTFGEEGYFGFGNLTSGSIFQIPESSPPTLADLSLEFETETTPPASEVLLAQLSVNAEGLAPGIYGIEISNEFALDSGANPVDILPPVNGSFEVVPEPSAGALLGVAGIFVHRRRKGARRLTCSAC